MNKKFMRRQRAQAGRRKNPFYNNFANRVMTASEIRQVAKTRYAQRWAGFKSLF
jgi:phosphopantetheinyl transferase (holo-ACP synthase)